MSEGNERNEAAGRRVGPRIGAGVDAKAVEGMEPASPVEIYLKAIFLELRKQNTEDAPTGDGQSLREASHNDHDTE